AWTTPPDFNAGVPTYCVNLGMQIARGRTLVDLDDRGIVTGLAEGEASIRASDPFVRRFETPITVRRGIGNFLGRWRGVVVETATQYTWTIDWNVTSQTSTSISGFHVADDITGSSPTSSFNFTLPIIAPNRLMEPNWVDLTLVGDQLIGRQFTPTGDWRWTLTRVSN
ncbi:MAG: hypothetical protein ACREMA_16595, partial [Longimicrobiales bacterium]